MRATVDHLHALPEHVVILSIETRPVPHVAAANRITVDDLGYTDDGITHVGASFGYMDAPNVPEVLRSIDRTQLESPIDIERGLVLPVDDRATTRRRAWLEPLAQASVPRHIADHR